VATPVQVTDTGRKGRVKRQQEGELRMGCLSSKEKYRVYERESERRIKSYRPAGKLGFTDGDHYHSQTLGYNNDTLKSNKPPGRSDDENRTIVGNETVREHSRSDVQSPEKVRDDTDKNDKGAFSSRNQFDRASQLRRSRKKSRRKSDAANTSTVMSPEKADTIAPSHDKENLHQSKLTPETPETKTASDIVMEEQSRVLTEALDNTTMSSVSTLSRLHEKTFSRAEYSSNYGNLI